MLYALHDFQRAALAPWSFAAKTSHELLTHPFSPWSHIPESRRLAANAELFYRLTREFPKPSFGIAKTFIGRRHVAVSEVAVVDKPFCKLVHFSRELPRGHPKDPKVLLVAPLSGHHATLLRDTVRSLLPEHEVYVTDWVDARMVPLSLGTFHFDDYVEYVREFIRYLGPDMHVVSVCQPTVPVLAAVSLMASDGEPVSPRTMIMMGGPIDARKSPTAVNNLAMQKPYSWFERNLIHRVPLRYPGYMRRVYPGFLQHLGFVAMNPSRHANAHGDFYKHLVSGNDESASAHRTFYDEYNAVLDMPAEYYLETIQRVFQEFLLPKGRLFVREVLVRPRDIRRTALLTIEGELDDISGNGQTRAAHELCTGIAASRRAHFTAPGAGHYGIFSGKRWREMIYPKLREYIRQHA